MGFLKDFFLNFENLLLSIIYFDYSKTLLLLIICMLITLIHVSISRRKYKKYDDWNQVRKKSKFKWLRIVR